MTDKTPTELAIEIVNLNVQLAKAKQPFLTAANDAIQSDDFKNALIALANASENLAGSSTVAVQINNALAAIQNMTAAITREAGSIQNTIDRANEQSSASAQPAR